MKKWNADLKEDCAAMLRAVREAGFAPQVKTVDYCWSDDRTPEEMADYLSRRSFAGEPDAESLRARALELSRALAGQDGFVRDSVNTRVAWIWWKTKRNSKPG